MARYFAFEKDQYKRDKKEVDALSELVRKRRMMEISPSGVDVDNSFKELLHDNTGCEFMTMNDYIRYRETVDRHLKKPYQELLKTPHPQDIHASRDVLHALRKLGAGTPELAWSALSSDQKWLIQLYSSEVLERFGRLNIVDKWFLPMGVIKMLRARKVTWQTVL